MKVLFSGGCKNGKSSLAERTVRALAGDGPLYYIATMIPHDDEDRERVRRHVRQRAGMGFLTLEQGRDVLRCLDRADREGAFLLDSVTALLFNEMFLPDGTQDLTAGTRLGAELRRLAESVGHIVFVSDYIYSDAIRYDDYTENYRRELAECDRVLASVCDTVVEVCAANPLVYKGALPW